jgi:glycosyltransferase involved in cell wall biosynthesis
MINSERVKVAYLVPPSRYFSGIERVVHELATALTDKYGDALEVTVIYCSRYPDAFLIRPNYRAIYIDAARLRTIPFKLRNVLKTNKFDIFVCAQVEPSCMSWIAATGLNIPFFITHFHGNPYVEESASLRSRLLFLLFRNVIAPRLAAALAVSPTLRNYIATDLVTKVSVYFTRNQARRLSQEIPSTRHRGDFRFLSVGRLSKQKAYDLLLQAFADAKSDLPNAVLTLVGAGDEEASLKALAERLGIKHCVSFPGYQADPASFFRGADCFVLSSDHEGFPLVLLEALSFGLPLLSTNCDFGPADIITDPRIGRLVRVGDVSEMAHGMRILASLPTTEEDQDFRRSVAAEYVPLKAADMHFTVLQKIVSDANKPKAGDRFAALLEHNPAS